MTADKQLKSYIDRVLHLKEEQDALGQDIRDVYAEAKGEGYDKTVMGKLVAHLRRELKEGAGAVAEAESIFDTYLNAYQRASGTPVATHTHEEKFDPITGEFLDEPVNAKLVATVATGMQTDTGRKALIAAVDIMISREDADEVFQAKASSDNGATGQAAKVPADSVTGDASRPSRGGDTPAPNSKTDAAISRPGIAFLGRPETENRSDKEAPEAGASGGMQDEIAIHPADPIAPAAHGEAEAPSVERVSPKNETSSAAANAGGDHVTAQAHRAATAGALVKSAPATKPLRPHCRNPGERCGGYGSTHCGSCLRSAKQEEVAA
ncbi:DUF2312 domain-containing protein [Rhizobium leguminosarum bv. viciae]|nr:DUF2312 domain-containing protein [Rhizobium leguminosarum bv. viciae]